MPVLRHLSSSSSRPTFMKYIYAYFLITSLTFYFGCSPAINEKSPTPQAALDNAAMSSTGKTLLAIFAHPDDESTIAPMLHKYVREGARAVVVIATDGRLGVNDFSGLEAGEGLAAIRREEMKCSAEKLGVELIHLDFQDQLLCEGGYDAWMPHSQELIRKVHQIVMDIRPDVMVTFGPDGSSNHMDHRLIGATATSVFLSRDWGDKPAHLYFYGTPAPMIDDHDGQLLRGVAKKYMLTAITYTEEDFEAAFQSFACHKSQVQLFGLRQRMKSRRPDNKIYLRKFVGPTEEEVSVF